MTEVKKPKQSHLALHINQNRNWETPMNGTTRHSNRNWPKAVPRIFAALAISMLTTAAVTANAQSTPLILSKTATDNMGNAISPTSVVPAGSLINYRVAFRYSGSGYLPQGTLTDSMSAGQSYVAGSLIAPTGWTPATASIFDASNNATFTTAPIFPNGAIGKVVPASSAITSTLASAGTGGDGLAPILYVDPVSGNGKLFYAHHHTAGTIGCIDISTGTSCAGYATDKPLLAPNHLDINNQPGGVYTYTHGDQFTVGNRIYITAKTSGKNPATNLVSGIYGLACWDIPSAAPCDFIDTGVYDDTVPVSAGGRDLVARYVASTNSVYFTVSGITACVQMPTGSPCAGFVSKSLFSQADLDFYLIRNGVTNGSQSDAGIDVFNNRYLVWSGIATYETRIAGNSTFTYISRVSCYDLATNTTCAGTWPIDYDGSFASGAAAKPSAYGWPVQSGPTAATPGFCLTKYLFESTLLHDYSDTSARCYNFAGAAITSAFGTAYFTESTNSVYSMVSHNYLSIPGTQQVIFPYAGYPAVAPANAPNGEGFCWDFATDAYCASFHDSANRPGRRDWSVAGQNGNLVGARTADYGYNYFQGCGYGLGDQGTLWSFDPVTGNVPCLAGAASLPQAVPAQQYCDGLNHVTTWQTLTISPTASNQIYNATVTVRDVATNAILIGPTFYPSVGSSIAVDLSSINYAAHPALSFDFQIAGSNVQAGQPLAVAVVTFGTDRTDQDMCYQARAPQQCGLNSPVSNTVNFSYQSSSVISSTPAQTGGACVTPTITIQKTADKTSYNPTASTPITYTLTVRNPSQVLASGVQVSDPTPAGVTITSWSCPGCSPASGSGSVTTTMPDIVGGGSVPITVNAVISPGQSSSVVNTATAIPPPGTSCTSAPCNSTVTTTAGSVLSLAKSVDSPTYVEGTAKTVHYTLNLSNTSATAEVGASISDSAPVGVTFQSWTAPGCAPASGTGNVSTVCPVAANGSAQVSITASIGTNATGTITNVGSVTPGTAGNCASATACTSSVSVGPTPKLAITKSANITGFVQGTATPIVYTLNVTNTASVAAAGVAVQDPAPTGVTIQSWTAGAGCAPASGTGNVSTSCSVPANGAVAIAVNGTIAATASGNVTNTATITPPPPAVCVAPSPGCNGTTTTPASASVSLAKTASISHYVEGGSTAVVYTLTATNHSSVPSAAAQIVDTAPAGVTIQSWTAPGCAPASGTGNVSTSCSVPANGAVAIAVNGTIAGSATGPVTNTARLTPGQGDACATANGCTATVTIDPSPKIAIVKSSTVAHYIAGTATPIVYTLNVTNTASVASAGVAVQDPAPTGVTIQSWTAGAGCAPASGTGNVSTSCSVPANGAVAITVNGTIAATASGNVTNTATITPPPPAVCVAPSPDCHGTTTTTDGAALSLAKTASITHYTEGTTAQVTYTLTASNGTPAASQPAQIVDTAPAGVTIQTWTAPGCTPASGTGNVSTSCVVPANSAVAIAVNGTIAASATGPVTNTATLTPGQGDACASQNGCTATVTIDPSPKVSIVKTSSLDHYTTGFEANTTYTLTITNSSSVDVTGVALSDVEPKGITFKSWTATGCAPASGTGNVSTSCSVPANGTVAVTVEGVIDAKAEGTLTNTATITPPPGTTCATADGCSSSVDINGKAPPVPAPALSVPAMLLLLTTLFGVGGLQLRSRAGLIRK